MDDATTLGAVPATRGRRVPADQSHFGGPFGAVLFISGLPLLTLYLWMCIHQHGGELFLPSASTLSAIPWPTQTSVLWVFGWIAFQAALDVLLPAKVVKSLPQRDRLVVEYRLNGLLSLVVTLGLLGALYATGAIRGVSVLDELGRLLTTAIAAAFLLSGFLFWVGHRSMREERQSGLFIYDYFMGTALNPRLGKFDLKFFFESKIGMTTWLVLTLAMVAAEYERTGEVSGPMALVALFQGFYVLDFFWFESAMLSTWDINYENYGFMLAFGFVVWMPFTFSLQAQYLVYHQPSLSLLAAAAYTGLNFVGYYVFRTANLQKHRFRTDPTANIEGKPPVFLETKRGTKLLLSGFWGRARHANYLGDLMMALAWCLPTGLSHVPPYFYFIYFAPLLIDRERRDDRECKKKYGEDWDRYCEKVPYRIIPRIY